MTAISAAPAPLPGPPPTPDGSNSLPVPPGMDGDATQTGSGSSGTSIFHKLGNFIHQHKALTAVAGAAALGTVGFLTLGPFGAIGGAAAGAIGGALLASHVGRSSGGGATDQVPMDPGQAASGGGWDPKQVVQQVPVQQAPPKVLQVPDQTPGKVLQVDQTPPKQGDAPPKVLGIPVMQAS